MKILGVIILCICINGVFLTGRNTLYANEIPASLEVRYHFEKEKGIKWIDATKEEQEKYRAIFNKKRAQMMKSQLKNKQMKDKQKIQVIKEQQNKKKMAQKQLKAKEKARQAIIKAKAAKRKAEKKKMQAAKKKLKELQKKSQKRKHR